MSGSKDKQRRKEKRDDGFDLRKNDKDLEAAEKRRKQTRTAMITLIAIAIVAIIVVILNSGPFYRTAPALRVNDHQSFSIADMNFYSAQARMQGQFGMFEELADMAQRSAVLHRRAVEEGLTIDQARQDQIDEQVRLIREDFGEFTWNPDDPFSPPFTSSGSLITAWYGRGMNLRNLRTRLEFDALGQVYIEHFLDTRESGYTEAELEEFYLENRDNFDRVEYRVFELVYATEETEEPEEGVEPLRTREEAEIIAEAVLEATEEDGEEGFLQALTAGTGGWGLDGSTLRDEQRSIPAFFEFGDWVLNNARTPGDFTSIEGEGVIFLLYFLGEEDNRYYEGNVRHILITPEPEEVNFFDEDGEMFEGEALDAAIDAMNAAEEAANEIARTRADELLAQWRNGPATEESFIELVRAYSADYREEADPGFYGDINRQTPFVEEFRDWAIDQSRRPGDVEIVQTVHGYHIMYFTGHSERTHRHILAASDMAQTAFSDWLEAALEASPWQRTFFARLTLAG